MDGVLSAYHKRWWELFGEVPLRVMETDKALFNKHWDEMVSGKNFETLEMLPGAQKLLDAVKSYGVPWEILSSGGTSRYEEVKQQKITWLRNHGIDAPVNIVRKGPLKAEFADYWHILVDDTKHVVDAYGAAGGRYIHHKDDTVDETIAMLDIFVDQWGDTNVVG